MKVNINKRPIRGGGYSLQLDYSLHGKRVRRQLGIFIHPKDSDKKEKMLLAQKIASQVELEIIADNYGHTPSNKKRSDFVEYFREFIKKSSRKDPRVFRACLEKLIEYSKPVIASHTIDNKFCQGFRNYLGKHLNGETPFNYFMAFKRVINEGIKDGLFQKDPSLGVKNQKPAGNILSKEVLSDQEIKILFNTPCGSPEIKRAFLFCCFTGLRAVDVRELTYSNIDFRNGFLKFNQVKTNVGSQPPLSKSALAIIGEPGKAGDKVFNLPSQNGMNKTLQAWMDRAKIKKHITFHCARHSFGTSLLVHGADLKTTSELLGHTTTRQTEKYTHISNKMKRKAVDALPSLV